MPLKAKPAATKVVAASTKPAIVAVVAAAKDTVMPPTAAKKLKPYFINVHNADSVTYYNNAAIDYAEVEVHVNVVVLKDSCKFLVAVDGMSISWQRATSKICFASEYLRAIMKDNYSTSHNHVIAYGNIAQKMMGNEVAPDAAG